MADGFQLELDDQLGERLERAARIAGLSPSEFTQHILEQHLYGADDFQWITPYEPASQAVVAEEGSQDWDQVEPALRARLKAALGRKA